MPVIIGIPVHNDLASLRATIKSIFVTTEFPHYIVFIESESKDGAAEYCDYLALRNPHIEVIHTKKEGPLKAYNRLFELARQKNCDLLLSQTDVIYPKLYRRDWLKQLHDIAYQHKAVTTSINGGGVSGPTYINNFYWVGGWCTYIPHFVLKEVKGFDEKYPSGYGVDVDFTYAVWKKGFRILRCNFGVDHHMLNERIHDNDPQTEKAKNESAKYFKKKWKLQS